MHYVTFLGGSRVRRRGWRLLRSVVLSLTLAGVSLSAADTGNPAALNFPGQLFVQDGNLSARIVAVALWQVVEGIGKQSGARVVWLSQEREQPVSVEFTALPLPEAMRKILGGQNFILFYAWAGEETRLTQIWISSGRQGGERLVSPSPPDAPIEEQEERDNPLTTLIRIAVEDDNPAARLTAVTRLTAYAQEDLGVRNVLAQVPHGDRDPQVQEAAAEALQAAE